MSTQKSQLDSNSRNTIYRGRCWNLTWNNYTEDDILALKEYLGNENKYIIGKEIGESNTPHLQGCIKFKHQHTFDSLKNKFPKCHWEKTKNSNAMENYCKKQGNYITNIKKSLREIYDEHLSILYNKIDWKEWQLDVLNIINFVPTNYRTIYWFWEPYGNIGKTFLCRYIEWKYNTIIVNGKQNDVFNGIKTYLDTKQEYPTIVLIDIPRTNENYVCYSTMEKIKDGLFYSGKYDGGVCRLLPLHLLAFANFPPEDNKMSKDRWIIKMLDIEM